MESKKPELLRLLLCSKKGLTVEEICECSVSNEKGKYEEIFCRRTVQRNLKSLVSDGLVEKIHETRSQPRKKSRPRGVRDKIRYRMSGGYLRADGFFELPTGIHVVVPLKKIKGNEYFGKMMIRYGTTFLRLFPDERKRQLERESFLRETGRNNGLESAF